MSEMERKNQEAAAAAKDIELEMDLMELLYRLMERWKLIAVGAAIGLIVMFVYSFMIATPMYKATSKLYVLNSSDSVLNLSDLQVGAYLTSDYVEVFDTWEVQEMVKQNLQLDYTHTELANMLKIENPSNTRILYITVTNKDPKLAAAIANEYAAVSRQYISDTMETDEPSLLSEAQVPQKPFSPQKKRNVALGILLGMFAACGVVVVQFLLDDKIKSEEDIRKYIGLNTLAVVPENAEPEKETRARSGKSSKNQKKRR